MEDTKAPAPTLAALIAGVAILVVGVGAYLALVLTGNADETDKLLAFLGPSVAALIIVGYQQRQHAANTERLEAQDSKLDDIAEKVQIAVRQTNGVLDQRIRDNATKALADYDLAADVKAALTGILDEHLPAEPGRHAED